jgi:hypothetical protein
MRRTIIALAALLAGCALPGCSDRSDKNLQRDVEGQPSPAPTLEPKSANPTEQQRRPEAPADQNKTAPAPAPAQPGTSR